jgi:uncharacterized protein (DUF302 family)
MLQQHRYGFGRIVSGSPAEVEARVTEALKARGFGVLTRIDVAATLKAKLGEEMPPYVILGACNPPLAHRAISSEPEIGLLLPCNVIVYQDGDGQTHVAAMDPAPVLELVDNPQVAPVAQQVRQLMTEVVEAV